MKKNEEFVKEFKNHKKEYERWENSMEGVLYELSVIGDITTDDDKDKIIIAKTLLKLPKKIRRKVLDEVLFVIMRAAGTVTNIHLSKVITKEELVEINKEFERRGKNSVFPRIAIEQPIIILNFSEIKVGTEMDTVAHEIAHFILGHSNLLRPSNPKNERKADDLAEKWGFRRLYKDY